MADTSPLPFNAVAPIGATPNITTNESPADISTTLAQATSIANMGGPGKNAAKAQQWLEGKLAAGATNDAEDAGKPLPFNSVKPISASAGKALPFNSVKPVSAAPTTATKTPPSAPLLPSQPMTAQEVQTYSKLFHNPTLSGGGQVRMENWGFSPQQTAPSWNPRQAGALPTSYKGWNPIKMWMKNSLPANIIKSGKYAPQIEQAKYEIVQSYNKAEDVVNNPAKYTPQQVQAAAAYMKSMDKNAHQSVAAGFKEFYHNLSVAGLVKGIITDPELLLPIFGESGGMLKAGLEAGGINTALTGAQELTTAQGLNPAQLTVAGTVGGVVGGALHGAVHTAGDALGKIIPKREPGEPLPHTTPIDKTVNVPYTGGVGNVPKEGEVANTPTVIYIHKGFPDTLSMKNEDGHEIEIPVTRIVAHVHEAEEHPLMHPTSPVPMGKVLEMKERAGNPTDDTFTPKIMKDIQDGTPLSYQDAHAIATAIENKYVHDHYGVDPKVYQDALKPYIKEAGKTSEKEPASNIPADLDTKPYEDAGHPEILKGQGVPPKESGKVNTKLLAMGATTAAGAGVGAYAAGPGHRKAGAVAGGLAGLFAGINMGGEDIGPGNKQRGMMAGRTAADANIEQLDRAKVNLWDELPMETIRQNTGWMKTPHGDWQFELSDHDSHIANLTNMDIGKTLPMDEVLKHPTLYRNYPAMKDWKVHIDPELEVLGQVNPITKTIRIQPAENYPKMGDRSLHAVLIHEAQHIVQEAEGFPRGANSKAYLAEHLNSGTPNPERAAAIDYWHTAGEVQARDTSSRMGLTPEERRMLPPDPSIPWEKQVIKRGAIVKRGIANNESIADHLQKTGEMDEEGNLHGMILPEDHLPNESDIVEKAKGGDQQAITSLYKKYMPRLTRSLYGMMRQAGPGLGLGPEDIANEAFFQAMRNLHSFKGNSAFYTWLHTIGRNTALNAIEKGGRQVPTTSMFDSPPERENTQPIAFQGQVPGKEQSLLKPSIKGMVSEEDTPEHMLEAHEVSNMVKYAISKLPNEIRDAIKMREFEGLTEQEIANKQGVPVGTVKSRLSRGREMLKESIRKGHGATFRKQMGGVTFDQTKRLGFLAGGAAAGYAFGGQQHHVRDAILGAMAGIGAGAITFHGIVNTIKDARSAGTTPRVSPILDQLGGSLAVEGRHIDALVKAIKLVQGDNSYDIAHALEGDKTVQLTPAQQAIKEQVQSAYRYVSGMAKIVGLNMKELGDYTTHIFAKTKENQDRLEGYAQMQASAPSTTSPFARPRVGPPTLRRALASGLTLKHDNFADSFGEYLNSMMTALHTKAAINQMKLVKDESGVPVLVKSGKAPYGYVTSNHPALRGLAMHPGIATEVSHLFDTYSPTLAGRMYRQLNNAIKRVWFSYNFFHGQTFMDVQSGNSLNPIKNLRTDIKAITGTTDFHKALANPTKGDVVDKVLSHGGTVGTRTGGFTEDVGSTLDPMFNFMEEHLNKTIPGLGLLPKGLKAVDHAFQTLIFKNMGNGFKGTAAQIAHDILERNWVKKVQEDPTAKMPNDDELWRQAVSFSSVSFGGLDWRTLANQCTNKYMRSILMHVGSPAGRRSLQLAFAAPDWLASTTAHWTKAIFGEGTGLKGIISPRNAVDLHRAWLARSVMGYMVYANGLNMAFTGHPIWDNKDPFMVSLGEGRKMQWMKELTDFPRMLANPAQEFLNKLAPTPKIAGEQVLDKQYLSAKGHAPSMTSLGQRLQVAAKGVSPIFSTQVSRGGPVSVISNLLGKPIYGTDPQAKERLKEKAKEKSAATRRMHEMAKYGG